MNLAPNGSFVALFCLLFMSVFSLLAWLSRRDGNNFLSDYTMYWCAVMCIGEFLFFLTIYWGAELASSSIKLLFHSLAN